MASTFAFKCFQQMSPGKLLQAWEYLSLLKQRQAIALVLQGATRQVETQFILNSVRIVYLAPSH